MTAFVRVLVTRQAALAFAALAVGLLLLLPGTAKAAWPGDNGKIAFMSNRDGDWDIFTMNSDGSGVPTNITNNSVDDINPAWSPNGSKIAFASNPTHIADFDLYVMNEDGSARTSIETSDNSDFGPQWSPDGTQLVFERNVDPGASMGEIFKLTLNGGGVQALTVDPGVDDQSPSWSPDGSRIAFASFRFVEEEEDPDGEVENCAPPVQGCYWELMMIDPDQPNTETRFNHNDEPYEVESSWSPDGSKLTFQANLNDTFHAIYTADTTGATNPPAETTQIAGDHFGCCPVWAPNSGSIVFASARDFGSDVDGDIDLYKMPPHGESGGLTPLTPKIAGDPANDSEDLDPDWQRVIYYYERPAGASPFRASLVPAQKQCVIPNNSHGAPASYSSCSPAKAVSPYLTMGTPTANGQASSGVGSLRVEVINVGQASEDDQLAVSLTDVRCRKASTGCAGALQDYTGTVQANVVFRITDTYNSPAKIDPGTMVDLPFAWEVPCTATGSPGLPNAVGSTCSSTTTANAVIPGFVKFGKRQMIELGQARVFDGGADGSGPTGGDNALFQIQGVFNP